MGTKLTRCTNTFVEFSDEIDGIGGKQLRFASFATTLHENSIFVTIFFIRLPICRKIDTNKIFLHS